MEFSEDVKTLLKEKLRSVDIYSLKTVEELKDFKKEVVELHDEYDMLNWSSKTLMNAAYGASANVFFYFYNLVLAGDITGECRETTKYMIKKLENFFHEEIWVRKDLQEQFNFGLDESLHDWYRGRKVWVYSDTDSCLNSTLINVKELGGTITIEKLYNHCIKQYGDNGKTSFNHESAICPYKILNYTDENGVYYVDVRRLIRHKVTKPKYKIKTSDGKEVVVTGDHSCVVFRDGNRVEICAKDINKETDKLLVVYSTKYADYKLVVIESIEVDGQFENEYVYDIEVEDGTHTFIANDILLHNSAYTTYGDLFKVMDKESKERYSTDEAKLKFILDLNEKYLDKQNTDWLNEIYTPRHAQNVHKFELETVSSACIYLKKKKYLKKLVYKDGKFMLDHPKVTGTGIEIIKSTTPKLCRTILTELTRILMDDYYKYDNKNEFTIYFNQVLESYRNQFYESDYEEISQSVSIGAYKKYVIDDKISLKFAPKAPVSVKAIAMYNYMAHKRHNDNLITLSGKIKYYRIKKMKKGNDVTYFGYPSGQILDWYPEMDLRAQWQSTVIDPINRFLEVMMIPIANAGGSYELSLF